MVKPERAKYGEDPRSVISQDADPIEETPNDVKTPNNTTRDERIRGSNSDKNPQTGFGRHMSA